MPVLRAPKSTPTQNELQRIMRMEVPVIVKLAERKLTMAEVMRLGPGAIIELPKGADEELTLLVNNKQVGTGQAVKVGENFGIKITYIGDLRSRIAALGVGEGEGAEAAGATAR